MEKEGSLPPVLRRKATKPTEAGSSEISVGRLMALSFERAARDALGLTFHVEECEYALQGISDLPTVLPDKAMWCLLDNGKGDIAALSVDLQLLAGLIEFQTLGCVLKNVAPERVPTRVDGALLMAVTDAALTRVSLDLEDNLQTSWILDYQFGAMIESKRALVLSLLSETFHVFNMRVSLEGGAKTGALKFVFPVLACEQDNSSDHIEDASDVEEFQREIRQAPALADAVLARLNISYAELIALSVGDVLELPADCIHNLSLEMSGQVVLSKGTLGQVNGLRAAKVWVPSSQDTPQTHTFDPVAERLQTPDDAILKETEVFLPPVEAVENELVLEQMQEAGSDPGVDDGIEDFSDLDDLDNYEPQVPQAVA